MAIYPFDQEQRNIKPQRREGREERIIEPPRHRGHEEELSVISNQLSACSYC
jgi:hypothetical protein